MLGRRITGEAPAEHGSALHPRPFAQLRGGLGRGKHYIAPMDLPSERRRNAAIICSTP